MIVSFEFKKKKDKKRSPLIENNQGEVRIETSTKAL